MSQVIFDVYIYFFILHNGKKIYALIWKLFVMIFRFSNYIRVYSNIAFLTNVLARLLEVRI